MNNIKTQVCEALKLQENEWDVKQAYGKIWLQDNKGLYHLDVECQASFEKTMNKIRRQFKKVYGVKL